MENLAQSMNTILSVVHGELTMYGVSIKKVYTHKSYLMVIAMHYGEEWGATIYYFIFDSSLCLQVSGETNFSSLDEILSFSKDNIGYHIRYRLRGENVVQSCFHRIDKKRS